MIFSRRQLIMGLIWGPLLASGRSFGDLFNRRPLVVPRMTIMGASSCLGYVKAVLPQWERQYGPVHVAVSGGGSYAGLRALATGQVDIALADVMPPPGYIEVPVRRYVLGRLPIVIVAHQGVGVKQIACDQTRQLFHGTITNWRDVGGNNLPVVVVSRPLSSGAREVVQTRLMGRSQFSAHSIIQLSNGAVIKTVADTPGAIGYVEAVMPLWRVQIMAVGNRAKPPEKASNRKLYAEPAVYIRRETRALVISLAEYLANDPRRPRFGIYPLGSEEGSPC